jgi:transcriptional regulator with XRE-family HTH domain
MTGIKRIRLLKEIPQKRIAVDMGVTQGTVSEWERGKIAPSADNLKKLSALLGCSIDELLDNPTPPGVKKEAPSDWEGACLALQRELEKAGIQELTPEQASSLVEFYKRNKDLVDLRAEQLRKLNQGSQ